MPKGRTKTIMTKPSKYDATVANVWRDNLGKLADSIDDWENGNEMALDVARSVASSLNSSIRNMAIDPDGSMNSASVMKNRVLGIIKELGLSESVLDDVMSKLDSKTGAVK